MSRKNKTNLSLGVGDGTGNLFVHGNYEALQAECEQLRKDAGRYRWLMEALADYLKIAGGDL